ncbi:hypothetical protein MEO93_28175, partial [Dolichospermum sp. ST_sed3]|nr:hypothetical protein [Dolichospermum sp. ST_sed3]
RVIRHWRAGQYRRERFKRGWMPPHPAFFLRRGMYDRHGNYSLDFPIAADYELMLRMLYLHGISTCYLPEVLIKMRTGGSSNPGLAVTARCLRENYLAWKANGLKPSAYTFVLKPLSKLLQFR